MTKKAKKIVFGFCVISFVGLYLYGAVKSERVVNVDMHGVDQSAYMAFAKQVHESGFRYLGGRNRMPVYPFLQAFFYRPTMSDEAFFRQGKRINIALSLLLLPFLFLILRQRFSLFFSSNLVLIYAFSVSMFKAAYFQCEILYYCLNFITFVLMIAILKQPTWKKVLAVGVALGVTHLTKASVLPGMALFVLVSLGQGIYSLWGAARRKREPEKRNACVIRGKGYLVAMFLAIAIFMIVVAPYICETKKTFGRYFYNVNSTFYMWCDSWQHVKGATRAHGDREGWPKMPAEQIPSFSKYFQEHNFKQSVIRISWGLVKVSYRCLHSYGYVKYMLIYLAFFFFLIRSRVKAKVSRATGLAIGATEAFLVSYFILYLLLYSWYAAIASGNRMILGQFLPFMYAISLGIQKYSEGISFEIRGKKRKAMQVFNWIVLAVLTCDVPILLYRVGLVFAGS